MMEPVSSTPTRDELITSLLKLATALAADDRMPLDRYTFEASYSVGVGLRIDNDEDGHAELERIAAVLDVEIEHLGTHHYARKMFGHIRYQALYIDRQAMHDHTEFMATRPAWEASRQDEPRCPDPECGEPLAAIASGAVGHCGRTCAGVDEETARVEEDASERRSVEREQLAEVEAERAEEPAQDWWFTFGSGQVNDGSYVRIPGTMAGARRVMVAMFGTAWSFQYPSAERAGVEEFGLVEIEPELWCGCLTTRIEDDVRAGHKRCAACRAAVAAVAAEVSGE